MLRFLTLFSLRLLAGLGVLGLLVSRQWGWSEYASPQLYVVYDQIISHQNQFFVVNANGSDSAAKLTSNGEAIAQSDCSPDGRVFAFLTYNNHLNVLTSAGLLRESAVDPLYTTVNVANDGTTALFDPAEDRLLIGDRSIDLHASDDIERDLDRVDISAQGLVLWNRNFVNIQMVSLASGSITPYVTHGYSGVWLANGQIFAFGDQVTDQEGIGLYGGQYVMDVGTQKVVRIGNWTLSSPLSPDGTEVAAGVPITALNHLMQVSVYNVFGAERRQLLTHDAHVASQPVCFLTFRPDTLIAGS